MSDINLINIAFACSEEYSKYLSVTLLSLLDKLDKNRKLKIYIITEDFSENSKIKINKLKSVRFFEIEYIYLKNEDFNFLTTNIKCPAHVTRIAAGRILLPILLKDIDKILILECDMLINDDIAKLYDTDLDNKLMGCVEDFASVKHSKDLWSEKSDYYNTGVCLINLKKLRDMDYLKLFKNKISKNAHRYKLQEQDIWNDALRYRIKRLDIRWNFYHYYLGEQLAKIHQFVPKDSSEYLRACKNPGIYHFVSEKKCWFPTVKYPYVKKYRYYEKRSPFYKFVQWHKYNLNEKQYKVLTVNNNILFQKIKSNNEYKLKLFNLTFYRKKLNKYNNNFVQNIFSVKNDSNKSHKIITILGLKFKIKFIKNKQSNFVNDIRNILHNDIPAIIQENVSQIVAREVSTALMVQKLHMQTFPQFKNINAGKNVAIIGCGPTVQFYNSELDTVNIALNKSILLDKFNFSYLFSWDYSGFVNYGELDFFETVKNMDCVKFFGRFLSESFVEIPVLPDDLKNKIYHFYSSARHGLPARPYGRIIHTDIETHPLADFMSVSFAALHFALYTQPKKIYLIGLDTTNSGHILNCNHEYYVKDLLEGYQKFKEHINKFYPQIEVISVNPVGLRGMFKDVYTQSYIDEHPELLKENVEIIDINNEQELVNI